MGFILLKVALNHPRMIWGLWETTGNGALSSLTPPGVALTWVAQFVNLELKQNYGS
jgi:hypothetical protein